MKKLYIAILILSAICLWHQSQEWEIYADTVTSGNVGLIIISTGVKETGAGGKSWATKLNDNFTVVGSTLGTVVTDISNLKTNNFTSVYSTNIVDSQIAGVDIVSGTVLSTHIAANTLTDNNFTRNAISVSSVISPSLVFTASSGTFTSSLTVTGLYGSTGSFILLNSSGMGINGVKYGYPSAACAADQIWKADGAGNWRCAADATGGGGGGGGGTIESTFTRRLGGGGDATTSSSTFVSVPNVFKAVVNSSITILAYTPYCMSMSSSFITMRIASQTVGSYAYVTPDITLTSTATSIGNTLWGTYTSTTLAFNHNNAFSVQYVVTSATVTAAKDCGLSIRWREGLDNLP